MTLIELMLVMTLIALLLGFGVGAISGLEIGSAGAGSLVRSTLRSANNWATARQAPSRVRIDPATGRIVAEGLQVVGTWHFEKEPPKGAFGLDGRLLGAELTEDGFIGKALRLSRDVPGARYEVPVQTDPAFALDTGFQIQVALRPDGEQRGRLLALGGSIEVEVTDELGLRCTVATQRPGDAGAGRVDAGRAVLATADAILEPEQWSRVLISYDRSRFCVLVEGIEVAWIAEEGYVAPVDSAMVVGGGQRPWSGSVDNLVISAVGAEEEVFLPRGAYFPSNTPKEIVFAAGGGLDRSVHPAPVEVVVEFDGRMSDVVRVNLYGTVE